MPYLTRQNHTLHYVTAGRCNHPPLLMLHGFLGSHEDFSTVLPALSQRFFCITPDLPGHGKTRTEPDCYTFPAAAQSLIALLNHLNITQATQAHLLGYSMGGRLALYLACQWPERFTSVILESASPGLELGEQRRLRVEKDEAIARSIETLLLPDFLLKWYKNPLFDSLKSHPEQHQKMMERRLKNRPAELARALRGLSTGHQPSLWHKLEQIKCPMALFVGENDKKFVAIAHKMMVLCSKKTGSKKPAATMRFIKGCGHNIHLESPDNYVRHVIEFVTNSPHKKTP